MSSRSTVPLLSLHGVTKRFGAVEALVDVDFEVNAHEVVALVGDNAAGKSTLAKVIAGVLQPDAGLMEIAGEAVSIPSPSAAHSLGIATGVQDLALCEGRKSTRLNSSHVRSSYAVFCVKKTRQACAT